MAGTQPARVLLTVLRRCCCSCCAVQTWHWGEKRRLAKYYSELYTKEKADEEAYTAELRAKLKALEDELLA